MPFHQKILGNGLTIIGETSPSARSVALGFFVATGARDEGPDVSGVTHFLEHMVFKGTPRRSAFEVNHDFDRMGGQANAYTSEENTVFHTAILPEYLPKAVDLLADILRPSLRNEDFDVEKEVIIEEIGMYEDQPMWSAYDHAKKAYFGKHPLGNRVLGTTESIRALTRDQMHAYFSEHYVPSNITVAATGNFPWPKLVKLIEQACGRWEKGKAVRANKRETRGSGAFECIKKDKVFQEHVFMISPAPPIASSLHYAADVLAMIVGDETGSRLYWTLIDPGLADSADMGFHAYEDTGSFYTSLTCAPEKTEKNLALLQGLFRQLQKEGVTDAELQQAKNKVLSRVVRGSERPMNRLHAIGMTWTYLRQYHSVDDELKFYEKVTRAKIQQVLERYPLDRPTTLALGPLARVRAPRSR